MTPREVLVDSEAARPVVPVPRRPVALEPSMARVRVRFVQSRPPVDVRGKGGSHVPRVPFERLWSRLTMPHGASRAEPHGIGEVPQHDHRLHPALANATQDVDVVRERFGVEAARFRFDARPLDRDAVGVHPELRGKVEVLGPTVPRVARRAACLLRTTGLLEGVPVRADVAAFGLVGGGRNPPQEAVGEDQVRRHGVSTSRT